MSFFHMKSWSTLKVVLSVEVSNPDFMTVSDAVGGGVGARHVLLEVWKNSMEYDCQMEVFVLYQF